ncbi:hypothetical protein D5R81_10105 [Parashewanella spongiae]|uniref:Death domain-containing protein n=1 Tax=Parashewanella spongiae TaxID=342950 RepID=A0A3A6TTB5_9GAMM|nr:hypothetical protein [Parashewanella spongiae]MCL1078247.1 hypothetical protein [Parashewanella spongiae]RJY15105.1 hypothetical protein D5R81_10105 [Parashewanella spongiae]
MSLPAISTSGATARRELENVPQPEILDLTSNRYRVAISPENIDHIVTWFRTGEKLRSVAGHLGYSYAHVRDIETDFDFDNSRSWKAFLNEWSQKPTAQPSDLVKAFNDSNQKPIASLIEDFLRKSPQEQQAERDNAYSDPRRFDNGHPMNELAIVNYIHSGDRANCSLKNLVPLLKMPRSLALDNEYKNVQEQWLNVLLEWGEKYKEHATVEWLAMSLLNLGFRDSAEKLLDKHGISFGNVAESQPLSVATNLSQPPISHQPRPVITTVPPVPFHQPQTAEVSVHQVIPIISASATISERTIMDIVCALSGESWKTLASYLGFSSTERSDISRNHSDYSEQWGGVLSEWKSTQGSDATYDKLLKAFEKAEMMLLHQKLKQLMGQDIGTSKTVMPTEIARENHKFNLPKYQVPMTIDAAWDFRMDILKEGCTESWQPVAARLGARNNGTELWTKDYSYDPSEPWSIMCMGWIAKEQENATYSTFLSALCGAGYYALAEDFSAWVDNEIAPKPIVAQAAALNSEDLNRKLLLGKVVEPADVIQLITKLIPGGVEANSLAVELGLQSIDCEDFKHIDNTQARFLKFFKIWLSRSANHATCQKLYDAFLALEENTLAVKFIEHLQRRANVLAQGGTPMAIEDKTSSLTDSMVIQFSHRSDCSVDSTVLAYALGISKYPSAEEEPDKLKNLLEEFRRRNGSDATLGKLKAALELCGDNAAAHWVSAKYM